MTHVTFPFTVNDGHEEFRFQLIATCRGLSSGNTLSAPKAEIITTTYIHFPTGSNYDVDRQRNNEPL